MTNDPTLQRNQPALTTSTGAIWLVVGGLFAAISLAVLIPMTSLPPEGVALTAAIAVAALYAGMVVARFVLRPGRVRLRVLAGGMIAIAAVSLGGVLVVAGSV
jgi:hypothetical protein